MGCVGGGRISRGSVRWVALVLFRLWQFQAFGASMHEPLVCRYRAPDWCAYGPGNAVGSPWRNSRARGVPGGCLGSRRLGVGSGGRGMVPAEDPDGLAG